MTKILEVVNPFDMQVIGSVPLKGWDEIDSYLSTATELHKNRKVWLPAYQRIEILSKTAALMRDRFEDLAFQIANEGGKPLVDAANVAMAT